ncbi:uncharacterized protein LOC115959508 [Quercus lobata]|uniref:Uncharacterized protein n=1 Tax=Quercus lobata TaxID=97700 RepID=A0A7N2MJ32_QUELO|nr:uncharacterized protein LOC115950836 [Quercus lobata]XP_030933793.1 uncharacterized protein LOC115959508 [Quercus lobata]
MCVCCPALRSSSREPVKRYKKLLAEIFPKSLDGPPNERKIVTLCEYAVKNPVWIPKIAKYLEERCYKELRVGHIKFINIVWERFTRLAAEEEAAKIERDNARQMETEALERERIAKRRSEKYRVAARIAEEKVHKFRIALITSWVVFCCSRISSTIKKYCRNIFFFWMHKLPTFTFSSHLYDSKIVLNGRFCLGIILFITLRPQLASL